MRPRAAGSAVLAAALAWPALASAERKVAPTLYECPPEAPDHAVDHDGLADVCAKRGAPVCPAGTALRADAVGTADRCEVRAPVRRVPARGRRPPAKPPAATPTAAPVVAPTCPPDLPLAVRAGADSCERTAPPVCPKDFAIEARAGEDRCVYTPDRAKNR